MSVAILGLAAYPRDRVWPSVELLVRSVRLRSPQTAVAFLTAPLGDRDRRLFDRFGVESIDCVELPPRREGNPQAWVLRRHAWILELYGRRHALYGQAIEGRPETHFLLADTRDVIVTAPLQPCASISCLVLSQEHAATTIAANGWNSGWIETGYGADGLAAIGGNPILCAGTVFGPRRSVAAYLRAMSDEVQRLGVEMTRRIGDQPLHNHLAYTGRLPEYQLSTAENGWLRSVGLMPIQEIQLDWDQGERPQSREPRCLVVHQYDRHLQSRHIRKAVARATGLEPWRSWCRDAYWHHGQGLIPRALRPIVRVSDAIKHRLAQRKDD